MRPNEYQVSFQICSLSSVWVMTSFMCSFLLFFPPLSLPSINHSLWQMALWTNFKGQNCLVRRTSQTCGDFKRLVELKYKEVFAFNRCLVFFFFFRTPIFTSFLKTPCIFETYLSDECNVWNGNRQITVENIGLFCWINLLWFGSDPKYKLSNGGHIYRHGWSPFPKVLIKCSL